MTGRVHFRVKGPEQRMYVSVLPESPDSGAAEPTGQTT
jgi:hypothetical protein